MILSSLYLFPIVLPAPVGQLVAEVMLGLSLLALVSFVIIGYGSHGYFFNDTKVGNIQNMNVSGA